MTTLNSTSILALIIAQNPYHIISIQDIKDYFELVHIETQELTANGGFKTAILKEL